MIWNNSNYTLENCSFCTPPDRGRIIYETENFYVILSLGAFVEGYVLINSKNHEDCCGAFNDQLGREFDDLLKKTKSILIDVYGACVCFEHGRAGACLQFSEANQHCYHAHMHCIPIDVSMSAIIANEFKGTSLTSMDNFREEYYLTPEPYLFVDDGSLNMFYITKAIRKQYLRHIASTAIGLENEWNWLKYPNWENIHKGKVKLSHYFKSNVDEY